MKVSTKGQVTIPQELREKTGIMPGSEVTFFLKGSDIIIKRASDSEHRREIVRRMSGKGTVKMTTDEIMALTRGE